MPKKKLWRLGGIALGLALIHVVAPGGASPHQASFPVRHCGSRMDRIVSTAASHADTRLIAKVPATSAVGWRRPTTPCTSSPGSRTLCAQMSSDCMNSAAVPERIETHPLNAIGSLDLMPDKAVPAETLQSSGIFLNRMGMLSQLQ